MIGMYGGKFLPFHMGHLSMIIRASTMVDELYVIISYNSIRDFNTCSRDGIANIPVSLRLRWITESVKNLPNITILAVEDDAVSDEDYDWSSGADSIKKVIGKSIDLIFGSEESYRETFTQNYPDATYECLDPNRSVYPISATQIRTEGALTHWNFLPEAVRPFFLKRIAIVGTESCGKSTLTSSLASYYQTTYVSEYGRTFTDEIGGSDGILFDQDFTHIAHQHKVNEFFKAKTANKLMFIDSEAIVTQYYSILYGEGRIHSLDSIIHTQKYDLILFLEPDVPWVQDGTRHHGEASVRLDNDRLLKNLFAEYDVSYESVSGIFSERFNKAVSLINNLLLEK